jgi:hypothetical protein
MFRKQRSRIDFPIKPTVFTPGRKVSQAHNPFLAQCTKVGSIRGEQERKAEKQGNDIQEDPDHVKHNLWSENTKTMERKK